MNALENKWYKSNKILDLFKISELTSPHICVNVSVRENHYQLDLKFIASKVSIIVIVK